MSLSMPKFLARNWAWLSRGQMSSPPGWPCLLFVIILPTGQWPGSARQTILHNRSTWATHAYTSAEQISRAAADGYRIYSRLCDTQKLKKEQPFGQLLAASFQSVYLQLYIQQQPTPDHNSIAKIDDVYLVFLVRETTGCTAPTLFWTLDCFSFNRVPVLRSKRIGKTRLISHVDSSCVR